jgi:hypothetical protein
MNLNKDLHLELAAVRDHAKRACVRMGDTIAEWCRISAAWGIRGHFDDQRGGTAGPAIGWLVQGAARGNPQRPALYASLRFAGGCG